MTKLLKGQSARTTSDVTEFMGGRQLASLQARTAAPSASDAAALFSDSSTDSHSITLDGLRVKGLHAEFGLPCPAGKELLANFVNRGGDRVGANDSPILIDPEIADEGTLNVVVGGTVSGNIDFDGDTDNITVFLVSGQTYLISLRGTGDTPINDSFLRMRNPGGTIISSVTDDDGGNDLYSISTYTATATGNYTIIAATFANPGAPDLGQWTVDVRVQGVDAVGDTNATSVFMGLGTTFGFREAGGVNQPPLDPLLTGDLDRYQVTLEEGHFYTFKVAGSADYTTNFNAPPTGTLDTFLYLTDAAGNILAANDDNSFPSDISSSFGFFAEESGTFYLNVTAYSGQTGGYIVDFEDIDYANADPIEAFIWDSADNIDTVDVSGTPTAYVYFALPGESFGELADNGVDPLPSHGWDPHEKAAVMSALEEFSKILGINYVETTDVNQAEFRLITTTSAQYGAYFYPQDEDSYGDAQGIGAFNIVNRGWNEEGPSNDPNVTTDGLQKGGFAYGVILHEFGHAHGLAHPHDTGGGSEILLGVTGADSLGLFDLNQEVYTVMSYNGGWQTHPDGALTAGGDPVGFRSDAGWAATLSAFDIAALQQRYGVLNPTETGDTTYSLRDFNNEGNWYECIWDTGGTDTIEYTGDTRNAVIDLTAATIDYSPTGGGVLSFVRTLPGETTAQALKGGFTIAEGVVIENATGGGGNDQLIGNAAANVLTGNDGNDDMLGRAGDDTLDGGADNDAAYYAGDRSDYTITANIADGQIESYTVTDNNAANGDEGTDTVIDVESLEFSDIAFNLAGTVTVFDGNGDLVSVHTTIQEAIDDATTLDGYTIFASSGTYTEDLTINKDLTIEGANAGVPGTGTRIAETNIDGGILVTANGVTIDGVLVSGAITGPNTPPFDSGIYVQGDDFSYNNSCLVGPDTAAGILTEQVTGLDVSNNLLQGYAIGIYVSGGGSTGSIDNNLFQGDGGPLTGMGNGVNSESSGVLIDTNTFDGLYSGSLNLFPDGPDPVDLETYVIGNTITNSGAARPVQIYPTADSTYILGTDHHESFRGDAGVTGVSLGYEGRGGNDHAFGGTEADYLSGDEGQDQLFGADGDDTLDGGADNDLLDGEAGIDIADFADNFVNYTDTLAGWLITSSEGNDFLENVEIVCDGADRHTLLVGATGFATLQAALDEAETGFNARLASGSYSGTVTYDASGLIVIGQPGSQQNLTYNNTISGVGITVIAANLADTITTGDGDDRVFGSGGIDTITTGAGNDILNGGDAADTLSGGAGNDSLTGGAGNDAMSGGADNDTYQVSEAGDVVTEAVGEGTDIIYSSVSYSLNDSSEVESLGALSFTGTTALNFTGNSLNNTLLGNDGNNQLNGKGGADVMVGRAGNDTYLVDNAGDKAFEAAGGGTDIVYTAVSYTLANDQEIEGLSTITWELTDAIDLTGNGLNNTLIGNAGANRLDGKGGNDTLQGREGADTFAFTTALGAGNVDKIFDFSGADDTIELDNAVFSALPDGALNPNAFVVGTAAADADDRIIYNSTNGQLFYDADGVGGAAAVLFVTLQGAPVLTAADIIII